MASRYEMISAARKVLSLYGHKNGFDLNKEELEFKLVDRYEKKRDGNLLWKIDVKSKKKPFDDLWIVLIETDYLYKIKSVEVLTYGGYFVGDIVED